MFDSIIFRQQKLLSAEQPLDLDQFFEALLFYDSISLYADHGILKQLMTVCGHDFVLSLVSNGFLNIYYLPSMSAIWTVNSISNAEIHSAGYARSTTASLENDSFTLFQKSTGKSGRGKRLAKRFLDNVTEVQLSDDVLKSLAVDFGDTQYIENAVRCIVQSYAPEYPSISGINFRISNQNDNLTVNTNIDFYRLNLIYGMRIPSTHSTMTPANLLSHLQRVRTDIHLASFHSAEIATNPVSSAIMSFKAADIIQKQGVSAEKLMSLMQFVNVDIKRVGTALASGERSYMDFLKLLEKSKKMRSWLADKAPDADLIKAYHEAVIADSWPDKLPFKAARWSTFTTAGAVLDMIGGGGGVTTAIGLGLGLADTFLLDKMLEGWKPNHFIAQLEKF